MSVAPSLTTGQQMSWEQYQSLGEDARVEYVDGRLIVSPNPTRLHQKTCVRVVNALDAVLPDDLDATMAWAWQVGRDEFIPDVMVHPRTTESVRFTGVPQLAVEVLSTNRSTDLVLKSGRYAAAGLPHHWVVDPRDAAFEAYVLDEGPYRLDVRLGAGESAEVPFGPASLRIDLSALLRDC